MVDIDRVRIDDILILEESLSGLTKLRFGPVIIIDRERGEVIIKVGSEMRSFPADRLWTIPAFITNCRSGGQKPPNNDEVIRRLMGFIISLDEGKVNPAALREIAETLEQRGVKPIAPQELLEVL